MTSLVFLSYSSKDHAIAETICGALENRGLKCWMSSRDIGPGENFQVSIIQAIRTAGMMVMVFSGNSNNSDEVKKEIALAGQHKLLVIPVRVEDVVPADAFQYELATRQWIDLFENWEHAIERLATQIRAVIGHHTAEGAVSGIPALDEPLLASDAPHRTAQPTEPRRSGVWPAMLAVLVLAALSGGGVWWWKTRDMAHDNDAWTMAGNQNTAPGYQAYLQAEPQGHHVDEANMRIDDLEWLSSAKQNTAAGYEMYKQIEPHGLHLADADSRIAALEAAAATPRPAAPPPNAPVPTSANPVVTAPPANVPPATANSAPASAREMADYVQALQLHSSAGYRTFLAAYGNSTHAPEIRQRLASCQMVRASDFAQNAQGAAARAGVERCR